MAKVRSRRPVFVAGAGGSFVPDRIQWLHSEMLKTRLTGGYCARHPAAGPCPYANVCEQCDNFHPARSSPVPSELNWPTSSRYETTPVNAGGPPKQTATLG